MKSKLDSKLQTHFICSIRIRSRNKDFFEKRLHLISNPYVKEQNSKVLTYLDAKRRFAS